MFDDYSTYSKVVDSSLAAEEFTVMKDSRENALAPLLTIRGFQNALQ